MQIKERLRQIYTQLSDGRISRDEALEKIRAIKLREGRGNAAPVLLAPAWRAGERETFDRAYGDRHVVLCEWSAAVAERLPSLLGNSRCVSLPRSPQASIAGRYSDHVLACFERIQVVLQEKSDASVLFQIVVPNDGEQALFAGLSALLRTATLENPRITGQVLLVPAGTSAEELARLLEEEKRTRDALIRFEGDIRQVQRWEEVPTADERPIAFRDGGVYVITGGVGALGRLFAREIAACALRARVILTGRSPLTAEKQTIVDELSASYRQVELDDLDQVRQMITSIRSEYGRIDGVLHSAGMIADNFILRKSAAELRAVLAPKVSGTIHLDEATRDLELDFFVLFSSFAGAMGNLGQADYAAANAFLDHFAAYRNRQVALGQRHGRTRSINWPLWEDGGMDVDASARELLQRNTGARPMPAASGMDAFHRSLSSPAGQILVAEGDVARIRQALAGEPVTLPQPTDAPSVNGADADSLFDKTQEHLRKELSVVLKMPADDVDPRAALEKYGIDSILAMKLTGQLEQTFGALSRTLFFEYQTIHELSGYFVQSHAARLAALFAAPATDVAAPAEPPRTTVSRRLRRRRGTASRRANESDPIAIVGLSGRYPEAVDIDAYWQNLREGKDCIVEVPKERWDWRSYFSEDRTQSGHHYSKWGGFISGVDEFDPLFFNISPKEAKQMDPQERLFLQHAWMAIEDAGYTRASLQLAAEGDLAGQVGVYAGVMYTEYQLFGAEASSRGQRTGVAGSAASIANRVSYAFNLHGPSVTLDTMCSSSLTAIHFACQDLKLGRTTLAIAGGVNVSIHPNKYLVLSAGQFISSDGHCQSFGEGGDGYIPGEGVGVVVLKRLAEAEADGDHIYGVIRGTALNHGGKTNGYTVPNPQAQATAISRALEEANVDARHVSYIEAHGTGTKLGDPIEIAALSKAFQRHTSDTGFCRIGSVKSNIGHCESAAGMAGLTKVLLQMQHREIVPSLHSAQLNPHIDFESTPFVVNQSLRTWEQPVVDGRTLPRIAGVSSFGAGGSNAHILLEEYPQPARQPVAVAPVAVVLSARTKPQLRQKAEDLLAFLRRRNDADLAAVAWTLQAGREAMDERLGLIVSSSDQLLDKLSAWVAGEQAVEGAYEGAAKRNHEVRAIDGDAGLSRLLELWVKGADVDWSALYGEARPRRIRLPVYPFAKERYWIDVPVAAPVVTERTAALHPLVHSNTSDLTEQRYSSTFRGEESFLRDGQLPPAAYLEMARVAVHAATGGGLPSTANGQPSTRSASPEIGTLELRDVVWGAPCVVERERQVSIAVFMNERAQLELEISSGDIVHCQARASWSAHAVTVKPEGERVRLEAADDPSGDYVLHPIIVGAALDACARWIGGSPSAIGEVRIIAPAPRATVAWVRNAPGGDAVDLDLCDEQDNVCIQLRGVRGERISEVAVAPVVDAPVREEILLAPAAPLQPAPRKRAAIELAAPSAMTVGKAVKERPRIALAGTSVAAAPPASSARLFDEGQGVFSLFPGSSIAELRHALDVARQSASIKVLLIHGFERDFPRDDDAVAEGLYQAIASFPYPVINVLQSDALDGAFLFAALCDFMVCSEDARYGLRAIPPAAVALLRERFGEARARDLSYATGRELRLGGWTGPIVPAEEVERHARELAATLATKPQDALRLLKQHLTRRLTALVPTSIASVRRQDGRVRVVHDVNELRTHADAAAVVLVVDQQEIADEAVQGMARTIAASGVPVIAALPGDAKGNVWLLAQFCDAAVYSRSGVYSSAGIAPSMATAFASHFGSDAGREIVLTGAAHSGADLRRRAGALVADSEDVVTAAVKLAESQPAFGRTAFEPIAVAAEHDDDAPQHTVTEPVRIPLRSVVVTVTAHPRGIVVVRMEDREAKNMFSEALREGLAEAFAHIEETTAYKVVILAGYGHYFASGGTKESLLAIQAGKVRFTDSNVFQLPLECRLPVIAAMQGGGIGAGWSLGMFADLAILSEESRYLSPYMDYGFTPGAGATLILADKLGEDLARESLMTAQATTGRTLKERGLRLPVVPRDQVLQTAMALAEQIAGAPRSRLIALKRRLTESLRAPLQETLEREVAMHEQTFVGRTDTLAQIESKFHQEVEPSQAAPPPVMQSAGAAAETNVTATLKTLLANELQMRESEIDDHAQFIDMGLDSVAGVTWIRKINEKYGTSIEATKVYSHPTLAELSHHVEAEAERAGTLAREVAPPPQETPAPASNTPRSDVTTRTLTSRRGIASRFAASGSAPRGTDRTADAIAVIGMAGQFPQANDLHEFWRNLAEGRDCITQVPRERWDLDAFYQPGPAVAGKTNCPWFGALEEYDRFDPLFFNISPTEALAMDPQQRLFLQACWHGIEHAGYDARVLSGSKCGVFVGAATGDYHHLSRAHRLTAHGFTGNATSVLAARISYLLNLQGPCVSIDTACSSSLVAIAQACDSLTSGVTDLALAGGVYVMAGPEMHIRASQAGMLSAEGRCFTFDQRADGFVPGEGVGVVVLKRLSDAQRDGDVVYGVIQGWGVNQDGKTNGITAPNPESQTRLQQEVYDRFAIDPAHIQLVEAHGTGTKLGDPIEVEGLRNAFAKYTQSRAYCALGSVKSNIGHTLTAAGVAGVLKLLLALQHRQLPPAANFDELNEHIDLAGSPFYVNTELQEWKLDGAPRRQAAISSFGFSGTNAHLVIGESPVPVDVERPAVARTLVPLSARTAEQLRQKAEDLLAFVRRERPHVVDVAYTLQRGRVAMDERVAFVVNSSEQLAEKLQAWLAGENVEDAYQGQVKRHKETLALFSDPDLHQTVETWLSKQKLHRLADLWVKGVELDWSMLYGQATPRRIALPLYPFAKERYWIDATDMVSDPLHGNLSGQRPRPAFAGERAISAMALLARAHTGRHQRGPRGKARVERQDLGQLLARPVWQASEGDSLASDFAESHVILCELPELAHGLALNGSRETNLAERYSEYAVACFEQVRTILQASPKGRVLLQIVIADERLTGLAGLLKTASLENPRLVGQLILVPPQTTGEELASLIESERSRAFDAMVRYAGGVRQVLRWEEIDDEAGEAAVALRDDGVYLITGGFGRLGMLFANDILERTHNARVVLTGRSSNRETPRNARITYHQADVADLAQVERVVAATLEEHGRLDGILHCAGVLVENWIPQKSSTEFRQVLAPKVAGTFHLDEATRDVALDFFVLFSSLAAVTGNRRTADYAAANAFQDDFAAWRNRQVLEGVRHGRTRSINWPVWQDGGMGTDAVSQERLEQATGMRPMQTATGLAAFHRSLALPIDQMLVVEGVRETIRASYLQKPRASAPAAVTRRSEVRTAVTPEQLQQRLGQILASVLKMDASGIDADQALMELGLDSFLGVELVNAVNREYGTALSQLELFDHPTLRELAQFLAPQIAKLASESEPEPAVVAPPAQSAHRTRSKRKLRSRRAATRPASDERIAIVGMSGRYPGADNLRRYWDNLVHGRNSVAEVPPSRWDAREYAGSTSSKWLGALDDIDCFDPLFFRISPQEADYIDPHHRLFLQESYRAFEDAGYAGSTLANRKCGVYLGISSNEYALLLAKQSALGASPVTSNHPAIAAARIAYYLNLKGPAISVDTACSSSLVAIHLACQGLRSGETDMALAGGVTLWLMPDAFVSMTQAGMLSPDGQCKAFDDTANGIVVGDGVGVVVLKRLSDAEADGDFIHGVILGSGVNQDGKTNGITAPSISSQIELERDVYARFGIHPETISYVETHGTGTSLGDPIELEALATVFREQTGRKNYCGLGSVKSNIGHTTSAAGVASVQKVLLSLRHRTLAPTLHVAKETSRFDFDGSPFYLVRETRGWDAPPGLPRRAAVSSFGFSGTNAHLVIEEYSMPVQPAAPGGECIVPLSARTAEQLRQKAQDLLEFVRAEGPIDLAAMAYTLQAGRDAMEERLALEVRSVEELEQKLAAFLDGETNAGVQSELAKSWIAGSTVDWNELHAVKPHRIALPTYPFAKEHHWIDALRSGSGVPRSVISESDEASIDDLINSIGDDAIDTDRAVAALRMLV